MRDAAVFLATRDARRVTAAVVAPDLTEAQLETAFAAEIDPAFLPRRFLLLDFLPRGLAGKVSIAALRALVADARSEQGGCGRRHVARIHGGTCDAGRSIRCSPVTFRASAIVPGVVLLQWVEALLAQHRLALSECTSVKFHAPLAPAQRVSIRVEVAGDL